MPDRFVTCAGSTLKRMCKWCFRVANASGQVLLLLSLIAVGREIGKEVQVRQWSLVEKGGGSGFHSMLQFLGVLLYFPDRKGTALYKCVL